MLTQIIDPKTGAVVRTACDAEKLEECLLKIQDSDDPIIVKLGDGDGMLHVIPC